MSSLAAPDFAFCLRVRRRGYVGLQGNATNFLASGVSIAVFFATIFGTNVSDISANKFFHNSVRAATYLMFGIDAGCHTDLMATPYVRQGEGHRDQHRNLRRFHRRLLYADFA